MNDTRYLVFVDDGENKNIHEIFADSPEQAKNIVISNGIEPDYVVKVEIDKSFEGNTTPQKTKTVINPVTGEQMTVISDEQSSDITATDTNNQQVNNSPKKVFDINGVKIGIINGEPYSLTWGDLDDDSDYRIINTKTDRVITNNNYKIQKRQWVKMPTE